MLKLALQPATLTASVTELLVPPLVLLGAGALLGRDGLVSLLVGLGAVVLDLDGLVVADLQIVVVLDDAVEVLLGVEVDVLLALLVLEAQLVEVLLGPLE